MTKRRPIFEYKGFSGLFGSSSSSSSSSSSYYYRPTRRHHHRRHHHYSHSYSSSPTRRHHQKRRRRHSHHHIRHGHHHNRYGHRYGHRYGRYNHHPSLYPFHRPHREDVDDAIAGAGSHIRHLTRRAEHYARRRAAHEIENAANRLYNKRHRLGEVFSGDHHRGQPTDDDLEQTAQNSHAPSTGHQREPFNFPSDFPAAHSASDPALPDADWPTNTHHSPEGVENGKSTNTRPSDYPDGQFDRATRAVNPASVQNLNRKVSSHQRGGDRDVRTGDYYEDDSMQRSSRRYHSSHRRRHSYGRSSRRHRRRRRRRSRHNKSKSDSNSHSDKSDSSSDKSDKGKGGKKRNIFAAAAALVGALLVGIILKRFMAKKKAKKETEKVQGMSAEDGEMIDSSGIEGEGTDLFSSGVNPLHLPVPPSSFSVHVPQNETYIIERGGRYHRKMQAGGNRMLPWTERIAFRHTLKEFTLPVPTEQCYTRDNVNVGANALLFARVEDPVQVSYGVQDAYRSLMLLAQSCLRKEIGRVSLDQSLQDRVAIGERISLVINTASRPWGIRCTRFEVRDVEIAPDLRAALERQTEMERQSRVDLIASRDQRDAMINRAEGEKQAQMKRSQARQMDMINQAIAEAHAIAEKGEAITGVMRGVAEVANSPGGQQALQLRIAEQYIYAYGKASKKKNGGKESQAPKEAAAAMKEAIGLLNTVGRVSSSAANPYVAPETKPYEEMPAIEHKIVQASTSSHGASPKSPSGYSSPNYSEATGRNHNADGLMSNSSIRSPSFPIAPPSPYPTNPSQTHGGSMRPLRNKSKSKR